MFLRLCTLCFVLFWGFFATVTLDDEQLNYEIDNMVIFVSSMKLVSVVGCIKVQAGYFIYQFVVKLRLRLWCLSGCWFGEHCYTCSYLKTRQEVQVQWTPCLSHEAKCSDRVEQSTVGFKPHFEQVRSKCYFCFFTIYVEIADKVFISSQTWRIL